jgi:hypothetical protein
MDHFAVGDGIVDRERASGKGSDLIIVQPLAT